MTLPFGPHGWMVVLVPDQLADHCDVCGCWWTAEPTCPWCRAWAIVQEIFS